MNKNIFVLVILALNFIYCQTTDHDDKLTPRIDDEVGSDKKYSSHVSRKLYKNIIPPDQYFIIDNRYDTILTCLGTSQIHIPKNAFIRKDGAIGIPKVKITITELLNNRDLLRSGISTETYDTPTNRIFLRKYMLTGALYIDAVDNNGTYMNLDPSKRLTVSVPFKYGKGDSQIYMGRFVDHNFRWKKRRPELGELTTLPLKYLDLKYYRSFNPGNKKSQDRDTVYINDPVYENTYIATRAFKKRLTNLDFLTNILREDIDDYLSALFAPRNEEEYYYKFRDVDTIVKLNTTLVDIYLTNIDKHFRFADSLVNEYLENKYTENSAKCMSFGKRTSNCLAAISYQMFNAGVNREFITKSDIPAMNYGNINMYDRNSFDSLIILNGLSEKEAQIQVDLFYDRNYVMNEQNYDLDSVFFDEYYNTNAVVDKLGWVGFLEVYQTRDKKEISLDQFSVNVKNDSLLFNKNYLVLPNEKLLIELELSGSSSYQVKGKTIFLDSTLTKKGLLFGIGLDQNQNLCYSVKGISFEEPMKSFSLELKETNCNELLQRIDSLEIY